MAPQLRILVTGDTNSGKSTLINAIVGRSILPMHFQSETSVLTYVVPQQVEEDAEPVLRAYEPNEQGILDLHPVARGEDDIRRHIQQLNRAARAAGAAVECTECRVETQLRSSLNVFVPPAAEWCDTQFLDIGGPDEVMNPQVQMCADLAYALSHRLVICVRFDHTRSRATQQLVEQIRARVPFHFDDELSWRDRCPFIFVITQVDLLPESHPEELEIARQNLRALLHSTLPDCLELVQAVPIVAVSAKNMLADAESAGTGAPTFEWRALEESLILFAGLKRDILQRCKSRRADVIAKLNASNLEMVKEEWPYYAASLWGARRDLATKVGLGSALVLTSAGTAIAVGVYLSAASAAGAAAAQAASATAEAGAAAAAANTWWAWLTGLGSYGAAAAAAGSAATAAEAGAATAAATATAWAAGSTAGVVSTGVLSAAAIGGMLPRRSLPPGVLSIAGLTVASCSAVGVKDARMVLRGFKFSASARKIKAGERYRDVLFYPDGTVPSAGPETVGRLPCPFLLYNVKHKRFLSHSGGRLRCTTAQDRAEQLWFAVPGAAAGAFVLQSSESLSNLRRAGRRSPLDLRPAAECTAEVPAQEWRALPGSSDGSIRLQNARTEHSLFFDGLWVGCWSEQYPDQDWLVIPKVPLYVGEFQHGSISGSGQFFWLNGAPLFKGKVRDGRLEEGFLFDERGICHGYFRFTEAGAELEGLQPEDVEEGSMCKSCGEAECMAVVGKALKPCGHGVACEACARRSKECSYCRAPIEGVMRVA